MCFFFNDTATTEIYTLSLHDALPISIRTPTLADGSTAFPRLASSSATVSARSCLASRSEEHTSELQSRQYLVCRLLLEKKYNRLHLPVASTSVTHPTVAKSYASRSAS